MELILKHFNRVTADITTNSKVEKNKNNTKCRMVEINFTGM